VPVDRLDIQPGFGLHQNKPDLRFHGDFAPGRQYPARFSAGDCRIELSLYLTCLRLAFEQTGESGGEFRSALKC
jgi:hypothetical protein